MNRYLPAWLNNRRTLLMIAIDGLIILGVAFLEWSPVRMLAMYLLELAAVLLGFVLYMSRGEKVVNIILNIMLALLLLSAAGPWVVMSINRLGLFDFEKKHFLEIYHPYFDMGIYLIALASVQTYNIREYIKLGTYGQIPYSYYVTFTVLLVSSLMVVSPIIDLVIGNLKVSLILTLIVLRAVLERLRRKYIGRAMMERKRDRVEAGTPGQD